MKLNILSPEKKLVESAQADWVVLPTSEGQIQVLPGHAAMVGTLHTGVFTYASHGKGEVTGVISTGFFEIRDDEVSVMAETIELKDDIDLDRAKEAQKKAEAMLQAADLDPQSFRKYQLKLQRALIRQHLAGG